MLTWSLSLKVTTHASQQLLDARQDLQALLTDRLQPGAFSENHVFEASGLGFELFRVLNVAEVAEADHAAGSVCSQTARWTLTVDSLVLCPDTVTCPQDLLQIQAVFTTVDLPCGQHTGCRVDEGAVHV